MFTYVNHCLIVHVYICLPIFTPLLVFTYVYNCLPMFTPVYIFYLFSTVYLCLLMFTRVKAKGYSNVSMED